MKKHNSVFYKLSKLYHRLESILLWIPIICLDHDKNYTPILKILKFKINRTKTYWRRFSQQEKKDIKINAMNETLVIIDRLIKDDYKEVVEKTTSSLNVERKTYTLKDQDKKRLFNLLENNLFNWW